MARSFKSISVIDRTSPDMDRRTGLDSTRCISCLDWPPQAHRWSRRQRKFGWPTSEIISEVIEAGCDIVPKAHPEHKQDEFQWRISFSRAEMILLKSLTPTQQIVYHLLRYFAKKELIEVGQQHNVMQGYCLKTLMLWACERKSLDWWKSECVIQITCTLLQTLRKWLSKKHCAH